MDDGVTDEQADGSVDTKMVQFYGDTIPVVMLADGKLYVPLRPITDALGLDFASQSRRVRADEVMGADATLVRVILLVGIRELLAIPLEQLPGYLFGIDARRVKPELRDKVLRYKREVFNVILRAVVGGELSTLALPQPAIGSPLPQADTDVELTTAEQNLQQAAVLYQAAVEQVALERRLTATEVSLADLRDKQQVMGDYVRGFILETRHEFGEVQGRLDQQERRLGQVERGMVTDDPISNAQATQISQSVKRVADLVEQRTGKRAFGMVYDTLYKEFEVTTYKKLAQRDFNAAMNWLRQWYEDEAARRQTSRERLPND